MDYNKSDLEKLLNIQNEHEFIILNIKMAQELLDILLVYYKNYNTIILFLQKEIKLFTEWEKEFYKDSKCNISYISLDTYEHIENDKDKSFNNLKQYINMYNVSCKILIGFYQTLLQIDVTYDIQCYVNTLEEEYTDIFNNILNNDLPKEFNNLEIIDDNDIVEDKVVVEDKVKVAVEDKVKVAVEDTLVLSDTLVDKDKVNVAVKDKVVLGDTLVVEDKDKVVVEDKVNVAVKDKVVLGDILVVEDKDKVVVEDTVKDKVKDKVKVVLGDTVVVKDKAALEDKDKDKVVLEDNVKDKDKLVVEEDNVKAKVKVVVEKRDSDTDSNEEDNSNENKVDDTIGDSNDYNHLLILDDSAATSNVDSFFNRIETIMENISEIKRNYIILKENKNSISICRDALNTILEYGLNVDTALIQLDSQENIINAIVNKYSDNLEGLEHDICKNKEEMVLEVVKTKFKKQIKGIK